MGLRSAECLGVLVQDRDATLLHGSKRLVTPQRTLVVLHKYRSANAAEPPREMVLDYPSVDMAIHSDALRKYANPELAMHVAPSDPEQISVCERA